MYNNFSNTDNLSTRKEVKYWVASSKREKRRCESINIKNCSKGQESSEERGNSRLSRYGNEEGRHRGIFKRKCLYGSYTLLGRGVQKGVFRPPFGIQDPPEVYRRTCSPLPERQKGP